MSVETRVNTNSPRGRPMAFFAFVALGLSLAPGLAVIPELMGRAAEALARPRPQVDRDTNRETDPDTQSGADETIRLYDTIYLTRDRKLEGTILSEGDLDSLAAVKVKLKPRSSASVSALATLLRGDIVRVVLRRSASDV